MPDDYLEIGLMLDAGPAAVGALAATQAFRAILDVLTEARNEAARLGTETYKFRDAMRDIQALKGGGPVTEETVQETFRIMRATGQTAAETHAGREAFLGEAAAYLAPYTPQQREEFQVRAGQYGKMMGIEPATMNQLMGRIIGLHPEGVTPEAGQVEAAETIRRIGMGSGVTSLALQSSVESAATQVRPGGAGPIADLPTLGAFAMAASRAGSEHTIKTTIEQFSNVARGLSSPEWERHLREDLNIRPGAHVEEAMGPIFAEMEQIANVPAPTGGDQEQAAQVQALAAGAEGPTREGQDLDTWLMRTYNMNNIRQRRALIAMFAQRKQISDMLKGVVRQEEDIPATPERVEAQVGAYYADPMAGGMATAEAGSEAQQLERGRQELPMRKQLIETRTRLRAAGLIGLDAMAENALENVLTKPAHLLSHDEALLLETGREDYERANRVRLPRGETGLASNIAGYGLTAVPMAAAFGLDLVTLGAFDQMGKVRQARGNITEWSEQRWGNRTVSLAQDIETAETMRGLGDLSMRTMQGPNARMMTPEEYRQFGRTEQHWTPAQETTNMAAWMKRLGEEIGKLNNQSPRPLGGAPPKPANGFRRS